MLLRDRTAIITGAARGIGLAIAQVFAEHGAHVAIADTDAAAARKAASDLGGAGFRCDVTDDADVARLFDHVVEHLGTVDILVNNAGITRDAMIHKMTVRDFREVIDVHLQGSWLCTRSAFLHMRDRSGGGSVVNLSSISGKLGNLGQANYAAAKAGVIGLTKVSAREGARYGIRVNAVQPGLIRTAMLDSVPSTVRSQKVSEIPLGRAGEPEEVAGAALFLASDLSSYVTGTVLEVAGGRGM